MKKRGFLLPALFVFGLLILAGCAPQAIQVQEQTTPTSDGKTVELSNPASVHCEEQGNRLEIRTAEDGSQTGFCVFPDGSECEEWAFYRGECSPGTPAAGGNLEPQDLPTANPEMQQKVVDAVVQKLASQLGVDAQSITVSSVETAIWRDACLGLAMGDEMCASVITPGFKVVLTAGGEEYVFHTDESGGAIRQKPK